MLLTLSDVEGCEMSTETTPQPDARRTRRRSRSHQSDYKWRKFTQEFLKWLPIYLVAAVVALLVTLWAIHER